MSQTPLILHSDLTGQYYIVTKYTVKDTHILAHRKYDCTERIREIVASASPLSMEMVLEMVEENLREQLWHQTLLGEDEREHILHEVMVGLRQQLERRDV